MNDRSELSRRSVLTAGAAVAGGGMAGMLWPGGTAAASPPDPKPTTWGQNHTQNGWPVVAHKHGIDFRIEGSTASVRLPPGSAAVLLLHVARRYSYEIESLGKGQVHGLITDRRVRAPFESNYLSGTALAIEPDRFPAGSAGNVFAPQLALIRDILLDCEGLVRWGGDDKTMPKEGHFQIDVPPGNVALNQVAAKIQGWHLLPGLGAGAPVDPFLKTRRASAKALQRKQRPF